MEIENYKTKGGALKATVPYKHTYYGDDIEYNSRYFASYNYRGETKIVNASKWETSELINKYLDVKDLDRKEKVEIFSYCLTYYSLMEDYAKIIDVIKHIDFYTNIKSCGDTKTKIAITLGTKELGDNSYYITAYSYKNMNTVRSILKDCSSDEIKEIYADKTLKKIFGLLESSTTEERKNGGQNYTLFKRTQDISLLEQDEQALETLLNEILPEYYYENPTAYRWGEPKAKDYPEISKTFKEDPSYMISILHNYLKNKFVVGKKYAELEWRLTQINKLLELFTKKYTLNDVCDGLPHKVLSKAILILSN